MILTDTEILTISSQYGDIDEYKPMRDLARAVEAAVLAKLCAGVEMPEPLYFMTYRADGVRQDTPYYTADQLRTCIAAARVRALEDAAQVVLNYQAGWVPDGFTECADAIRALKGTTP